MDKYAHTVWGWPQLGSHTSLALQAQDALKKTVTENCRKHHRRKAARAICGIPNK
jgi:hypothetical protein